MVIRAVHGRQDVCENYIEKSFIKDAEYSKNLPSFEYPWYLEGPEKPNRRQFKKIMEDNDEEDYPKRRDEGDKNIGAYKKIPKIKWSNGNETWT